MSLSFSIIIPVHNESDAIMHLLTSIINALPFHSYNYEIIIVDDFSYDSTYHKLRAAVSAFTHLRIARHGLHHGQTKALQTGVLLARTDIIVTMDGDGQNDPSDIPAMLEELQKGWDCICGCRTRRYDPVFKRIVSIGANAVRRFILDDHFRDLGCGMRVCRKECLHVLGLFNGTHRFLALLIHLHGYRVLEFPIRHYPRVNGQSKYGALNRLIPSLQGLWFIKRLGLAQK